MWVLPDLLELAENLLPGLPGRWRDPLLEKEKHTRKQHDEPERLLRFAFAVAQRYLRAGERRRSWFINLAFTVLQKQTMRLRSTKPCIHAYSETQTYFHLQLVHAALSELTTTGKAQLVQDMNYPLFREMFDIWPSAWTVHYSRGLWDSPKARASFTPPDLMPLPDTIHPRQFNLDDTKTARPNPNEPYRKLGLLPELPSPEILHFHQALVLEDAKPISPTLTPSEVTTHAHLLKYIHTNLIVVVAATLTTILPLARQQLTLLNICLLSASKNPPNHHAEPNPRLPFVPFPDCHPPTRRAPAAKRSVFVSWRAGALS
ncbi:hypothetical protein C8A00DRAFT_31399 [Chaetomidium leptoderma]|uniref:Uncharacterized protein n=1 Tax=Chaetomidium leptoderma TaxID=669021 RepID=A0AAN6ZZC1_9PEZI|nr:hypothetical protein C8A00DRAFT_31399 [Chaetomidium leptoderma]